MLYHSWDTLFNWKIVWNEKKKWLHDNDDVYTMYIAQSAAWLSIKKIPGKEWCVHNNLAIIAACFKKKTE